MNSVSPAVYESIRAMVVARRLADAGLSAEPATLGGTLKALQRLAPSRTEPAPLSPPGTPARFSQVLDQVGQRVRPAALETVGRGHGR